MGDAWLPPDTTASSELGRSTDGHPAGDMGAPVNLLSNTGCENGTTGWDTFRGTVSVANVAHSGTTSCRLCNSASSAYSCLDSLRGINEVLSPLLGQTYRARAWIRAAPGITGMQATISIREWITAYKVGNVSDSAKVPVSDTAWTMLEITHTVTASGDQYLDEYVYQESTPATCAFIDDQELVLLP